MTLPRTEVTTGLLEELARFKVLIQPLSPAEWATPSLAATGRGDLAPLGLDERPTSIGDSGRAMART